MSGTVTPLNMTIAGPSPTAPTDLRAALVATATGLAPGLTTDLPGSLIEDLASTATGALVVADQARVDLINSFNPRTANPFILNQLGQIYGVPIGTETNTSVYLVFSGPAGYPIPPGFTVSDGAYQYSVRDGGVIATGGSTSPLFAVATQQGAWAVPAGSVTQIATSVPTTVTLTVTNPLDGTPGAAGETEESYRAAVMQAGLATAQGTPTLLKTLLNQVNGVDPRLVSVRQKTGGWEVIVGGGGDPYEIGGAIFRALFDVSNIVGSVISITNITNASNAIVTTDLNHGYSTGQNVSIDGVQGMPSINRKTYTITVIDAQNFSIPFNSISAGTYTGGGFCTPNFRNQTINIYDYPDIYTIPFVVPPNQTVSMVVTWNTTGTGFVSPVAVAAASSIAISNYINSIPVGQPINLFELQATFQNSVSGLVSPTLVTRLIFAVSINGVGVSPAVGTGIISGDPESYFTTTPSAIIVNQG